MVCECRQSWASCKSFHVACRRKEIVPRNHFVPLMPNLEKANFFFRDKALNFFHWNGSDGCVRGK